MTSVVFKADRIKVVATKMENSIADYKREGRLVASSLIRAVTTAKPSNRAHISFLAQQKFLKGLRSELKSDASAVVSKFEQLRDIVAKSFVLYAAADFQALGPVTLEVVKGLAGSECTGDRKM